MINVTLAGRLGKNAELRQAGQSNVLSFNVAGDTGFGARKQSHWFECSLWGKRGEAMQQYLNKGQEVVVIGEFSEREYNGKQYKEINVLDIKLMGGSQSQGQQQNNQQQNNQQQGNPQKQGFNNQMTQAPRTTMNNAVIDDDCPF